jgi:hypothetical protein
MYFSDIYPIIGVDRPLGLQKAGVHRISRQAAHECAKGVRPTPQEIPRILISVRGIVRPEELSD